MARICANSLVPIIVCMELVVRLSGKQMRDDSKICIDPSSILKICIESICDVLCWVGVKLGGCVLEFIIANL